MTNPDFSPSWSAIGGVPEGRGFSQAEIAARALGSSLRMTASTGFSAGCKAPPFQTGGGKSGLGLANDINTNAQNWLDKPNESAIILL